MAKPLTKEAFLEGKPFYRGDHKDSVLGARLFKCVTDEKEFHSVYLFDIHIQDSWRHHANVQSITSEYIIVYTSICGQTVDKKIYFHEYNLVEEDKADEQQ